VHSAINCFAMRSGPAPSARIIAISGALAATRATSSPATLTLANRSSSAERPAMIRAGPPYSRCRIDRPLA